MIDNNKPHDMSHTNEDYKNKINAFNTALANNPNVTLAAEFYNKSVSDVIKILQTRISTKGDNTGNTRKVYIDFTDTVSGITIKQLMTFC